MPPPVRTIFHAQMWPETFSAAARWAKADALLSEATGLCLAVRKCGSILLIFLCGSICEVDLIYLTSPLRVCPG